MERSMTEFSPRRIAWVTAILSLLLAPAHAWVSCQMSGQIALCGVTLVFITGILSLADKTGKKAIPFAIAVIGLMAHILCTH